MSGDRAPGRIRVGISGWQYDGWRGDFYPTGLPRRAQLAYVADRLSSVELNGPFYSLQRPTSYEHWAEQTPEDFVFAVKGGRYITHLKQLRDVDTALANFFASGMLLLGDKLGPFLWQLPARADFDRTLLADFLQRLPRTTADVADLAAEHDDKVRATAYERPARTAPVRHALEVRNSSFASPVFYDLLREHDVACVVSDGAARWPVLDVVTAPFDYIRLHGHTRLYASRYADASLRRWADRCHAASAAGRDVYVYFDNDADGHAPHDALRLTELLGELPG